MFKVAGIFALAIAVEAYFGLNSLVGWLVWTISWLPANAQLVVGLSALVVAVVMVAVVGWLAVALLGAIAVWPIFGLSLGFIDRIFFGWAHQVVKDPTDPTAVVGTWHLFHYGALAVIAATAIYSVTWVVRRL